MPKIRPSGQLPGAIIAFASFFLVGGGMIAITGVAVQESLNAQEALKQSPRKESTRFHKVSGVETNQGEINRYYQFKGGRNLVADTTYAIPLNSISKPQLAELVGTDVTVSIAPKNFAIGGSPDYWLVSIEANGKQYLDPVTTSEMYLQPKRQRLYWIWLLAAGGILCIYIGGKVLIFHLT